MAFTVKQARMLKALTQDQCAAALGVHVQTYRKLEENPDEMTMKQAYTFSKCVGMPMANIIFLPEK